MTFVHYHLVMRDRGFMAVGLTYGYGNAWKTRGHVGEHVGEDGPNLLPRDVKPGLVPNGGHRPATATLTDPTAA